MLRQTIESEFIDDTIQFITDGINTWTRKEFLAALSDSVANNIYDMHILGSIMYIKLVLKQI